MIKCQVCGKKLKRAKGVPGHGWACPKGCVEKLLAKREVYHKELLDEGLLEMPDRLKLVDFERFALKYALHVLRELSGEERELVRQKMPTMLVPEELALDIKDKLLRHISSGFFVAEEARGHARLFHGGTYKLENPIPAKVMIRALSDAKLIEPK